jgi:hypothetical protein
MRVLIYKRTHPFDPNEDGVFGCEDCMGAVRRRRFDAVIGVGGIGAEAKGWKIDRRLNWVGIGVHKAESIPVGFRGPLITFDRFILLNAAASARGGSCQLSSSNGRLYPASWDAGGRLSVLEVVPLHRERLGRFPNSP